MELRWLTSFVAVAEELHFGRASDRLHLAPSALSAQIKALESHLGVLLIDRGRRRHLRLTDAGELFFVEARLTLEQAERAVTVGRRAGRGEVGRAEIAYVASAAFSGALTRVLAACAERGDLTVGVRELETPAQLEALASGEVDVGFLRGRPTYPPGLTAVCLLEEPIVLALPERHRLAGMEAVPSPELGADTFVVPHFDEEHDFRDHVHELARVGGFAPRLAPPVKDFVAALTLVAGGLGVALVPDSLRCVRLPGVVHRPPADARLTTQLVGVHRRRDTSPAVRQVIRLLRTAAAPRAVA
ncbi:LysR substrate-binding domain-containing protein [Streptomyces sp. NPDC046862]|uniref:LysR substrate-binding domain-containing protein n=1 Tax=Streptomyces sp. NPDC046862 TaxID=3154603 RepID=UPI0034555A30